jgi:hypothetical protein
VCGMDRWNTGVNQGIAGQYFPVAAKL